MIEIGGQTLSLDDPRLWARGGGALVAGAVAAVVCARAGGGPVRAAWAISTARCGRWATGSSSCTAG